MAVTRTTLAALQQALADLDGITDAQTRRLVELWVGAWDSTAAELDAAVAVLVAEASDGRVTVAQIMRTERAVRAIRLVQEALDRVAAEAGVTITGSLAQVVASATAGVDGMVAGSLPPNMTRFVRVDPAQVDAIVRRSTQRITAASRRLSRETQALLRRELVRGVTVGANPRVTARRILARTEDRFNGGLSRALTISRTETLDAYRTAATAQRKASADVVEGWEWVASLGARTCRACLAQHGTIHPATEDGPLGHQNCRCVAVPVTRSWADLGFDIPEPASLTPDADRWFDRQSADTQRRILGDNGYRAWKAGDYPRSSWSHRRETSGWRDSYVPSKPPASVAAAA